MWHKTHDMLVKAIGLAALSFLMLFLIALPVYQNINKLSAKIKTKTKDLDAVTSRVAILSKLDKNVLAARVATMDEALPPKKDVMLYLTSIDGLSRELGLALGGLSLKPGNISEASESGTKDTKVAQGLQTLETEIKIEGNEDNIYKFLKTIENVLPLMQIKDVMVDVSSGDKYSLSLSLGMLWAAPSTNNISGAVTLFGEEEDRYFTQLASFRSFEALPNISAIKTTGKANLFAP